MNLRFITLFSLSVLSAARRNGRSSATDNDYNEIGEKSRVTSFIVTGSDKARIECWEIGTLIPDRTLTANSGISKGTVSRMTLADEDDLTSVELHSFAPGTEIFSGGEMATMLTGESKAVLTTIKNGMLEVETTGFSSGPQVDADDTSSESHIFADLNGDDWFYFEDETPEGASQKKAPSNPEGPSVAVRTRSGQITSTVTFYYEHGLEHRKLHDGACKFAGLKDVPNTSAHDHDAPVSFRQQDL